MPELNLELVAFLRDDLPAAATAAAAAAAADRPRIDQARDPARSAAQGVYV
jgi:hypothetical protein